MLKFKVVNYITIALLAILTLVKAPVWLFVVIALSWLTLTCIGSFHIRWNYHIDSLNHFPEIQKKQVAITFDDGPNDRFTPQVLNLLQKYNVKATFFCVGQQMKQFPEITKRLVNEGHTVGNHTFSHNEQFGFFSTKKVIEELQNTNALCKELIGKELLLFRPPFGVTNPRIKKAIDSVGLQSIGWSVRSLDTTSKSSAKIFQSIKNTVSQGDVILLHDTSEKTVVILEQLLVYLKEQNFELVSIPTLFNIKAYA